MIIKCLLKKKTNTKLAIFGFFEYFWEFTMAQRLNHSITQKTSTNSSL